ncbi:MAG: DUF1343 domain-containing protein [Oscillospiraceae bacterium]|nr:DUF1343 domain-containing protein [Oscillospiraceae bacterium]
MKKWKNGAVTLATDELREKIRGKKIALMMNSTAIDNEGRLLIDVIIEEKWADVEFFFGMEHGVRGDLYAGDGKLSDTDAKTGIKIVNLYDYFELRPPVEWVEKVDAVVFSAQDVGVRHWTYTPWLMTLLESCAKADREVIILDRPNPIRGDIVEGEIPKEPFNKILKGLVSGVDYPLRHGMTIGELALMYNDMRNVGAKITVLKMRGWRRDMWYDETGLVWVPGSPNMPDTDTPLFFAATGLMQAASFSLGIGTTTPFEFVGAPDFDGDLLTKELNALDLPGIYFIQKYYMAMTYLNPTEGAERKLTLCNGAFMVINDRDAWRPVETQLYIMDTLNRLFPDKVNFEHHGLARIRMCTDKICDTLKEHKSLLPIIEEWRESAEEFKKQRAPYLLYK